MACALSIAAGSVAGAEAADPVPSRPGRPLIAGVLLATALVLRAGFPCHDAAAGKGTDLFSAVRKIDLSPLADAAAVEALIAGVLCRPLGRPEGDGRAPERGAPAMPGFDGDPPLCLHGGGTTASGGRAGACRAARRRLPLSATAGLRTNFPRAPRAMRTTAHRRAR